MTGFIIIGSIWTGNEGLEIEMIWWYYPFVKLYSRQGQDNKDNCYSKEKKPDLHFVLFWTTHPIHRLAIPSNPK